LNPIKQNLEFNRDYSVSKNTNHLSPVTSTDVVWHHATVTRIRREQQNEHKSVLLWFTGLSGAGKSTLAHAVEETLHQTGCRTFVLDGDNVRHGLCGDLGFTENDRKENIRRVGEASKLFLEAGVIVLTAFISPFREDRERVRKLIGNADFIEIYCHCPLEICENRDVKGLYKKARQGLIKDFTGISSPYEMPEHPELVIDTAAKPLEECVVQVIEYLQSQGKLPKSGASYDSNGK
jgi:adenylylsulfate kinase